MVNTSSAGISTSARTVTRKILAPKSTYTLGVEELLVRDACKLTLYLTIGLEWFDKNMALILKALALYLLNMFGDRLDGYGSKSLNGPRYLSKDKLPWAHITLTSLCSSESGSVSEKGISSSSMPLLFLM